jgi:hypothetical protein
VLRKRDFGVHGMSILCHDSSKFSYSLGQLRRTTHQRTKLSILATFAHHTLQNLSVFDTTLDLHSLFLNFNKALDDELLEKVGILRRLGDCC